MSEKNKFPCIETIKEIINDKNISPTFLYNEGWMLRLILKWFEKNAYTDKYLSMKEKAIWYSEALLSSKFLAVEKNDDLAEKHTHADGVYGDIKIGEKGRGDLVLEPDCKQFVVVEAKMFSPYSQKVKNAPRYNQAARTIACMCHIWKKSMQSLENMDVAFYTIIPETQRIDEPTFNEWTDRDHIKRTVLDRVMAYNGRPDFKKKDDWYKNDFYKFSEKIKIDIFHWEDIIKYIKEKETVYGKELDEFYKKCEEYNKK